MSAADVDRSADLASTQSSPAGKDTSIAFTDVLKEEMKVVLGLELPKREAPIHDPDSDEGKIQERQYEKELVNLRGRSDHRVASAGRAIFADLVTGTESLVSANLCICRRVEPMLRKYGPIEVETSSALDFQGYRIPISKGCDEPLTSQVSRTQTNVTVQDQLADERI
jgi:hypothetical protein